MSRRHRSVRRSSTELEDASLWVSEPSLSFFALLLYGYSTSIDLTALHHMILPILNANMIPQHYLAFTTTTNSPALHTFPLRPSSPHLHLATPTPSASCKYDKDGSPSHASQDPFQGDGYLAALPLLNHTRECFEQQ